MNTELNKSRTTPTCIGGDEFLNIEQGCPLLMQKMNRIARKESCRRGRILNITVVNRGTETQKYYSKLRHSDITSSTQKKDKNRISRNEKKTLERNGSQKVQTFTKSTQTFNTIFKPLSCRTDGVYCGSDSIVHPVGNKPANEDKSTIEVVPEDKLTDENFFVEDEESVPLLEDN